MHVSKTLDYAIRSLTFIGMKGEGKVTFMREISKSENIPISYLAKVMRELVRDGLVRSIIGPDGGYVLAKKPENITMMDIYEAVMGQLRIIDCMSNGYKCYMERKCYQIILWSRIQNSITNLLKNTRLSEIIKYERSFHGERKIRNKRTSSKR